MTCPNGCHTFLPTTCLWYSTAFVEDLKNMGNMTVHNDGCTTLYCWLSHAELRVLNGTPMVTQYVDRSVALVALDAVQPLNCAHCCIGDCTPFGDGPDCAERRLAHAERRVQAKGV